MKGLSAHYRMVQVDGLYVFYDFIDEAEEQKLLAAVRDQPWDVLPRRRVQHWGYEFDYKTRNVDISKPLGVRCFFIHACLFLRSLCSYPGPLPAFVSDVVNKMNEAALVKNDEKDEECRWPQPDQLTVNEYEEGVGIGAHVDTHSGTILLPPASS